MAAAVLVFEEGLPEYLGNITCRIMRINALYSQFALGVERMEIVSGDKLVISAGGSQKTWTVSAINNHVVKYFDEENRYGQISTMHLQEMIQNRQVTVVKSLEMA